MPLTLFLTFDVESKRRDNYITCEHVPGAPGTYWIMDELERHELRGVFFVNVYEHALHPDGWMQSLLRDIHARGHEVALHCHPSSELEFYRRVLPDYDVAGQTRILQYGVDFIDAAIGVPPVSFRAGAFRINDDTFRALESCGLAVDSSLLAGEASNLVRDRLSVNKPVRYGEVREHPVTALTRGRQRSRLDLNLTPDLDALTTSLAQMVAAGCDEAVFIGHSFSFVLFTRDAAAALPGTERFKEGKYPASEDAHLESLFTDFLQWVAERRDEIETGLFRDVADSEVRHSGPDYQPRVPTNRLSMWPRVEDYRKWPWRRLWSIRTPYRSEPRRLVLHAGTWKTGSKSLQAFWARNRKTLRAHGIDYPLGRRAAYVRGGNPDYQSRILSPAEGDAETPLQHFADDIGAGRFDVCLLSHENICNQPQSRLVEFVSALSGWDVSVVLYLRRQDLYAQSLYNQHVKGNVRFTGSFEEHFRQYRDRYDYRAMVQRLADVFGARNLVVRAYEREQFHGGTIQADFVHHAFGLDGIEGFALPERDRNARLNPDALEFKRRVNATNLPNEQKRDVGQALVEYCASVDETTRRAFTPHASISPKRRREILATFDEGNAWIARRYLTTEGDALFLEPPPDDGEAWTEYPGLSPEMAAEIGAYLDQHASFHEESRRTLGEVVTSLRR